jgi:peptidoglycan/LPS O-acetylase OafA/YrhL
VLAAAPEAGEQGAETRLAYRPALDGLRALAVVAVFGYHAGLGWARAGFLGVDVFFVLSGYLITALLLHDHQREGRLNLVTFWKKRARRLLPAVVVVLAAVAVAVPLLAPEQAYRLRGDLLAALGYVSNWRLIFEDQSYFQSAGRPPLLQHLWSLAVEEQFYLVWPVVLLWALRGRRALNPRLLVRPLLLAAVASTVLMALLFEPYSDPSRVYYGTDTRAAALLIGAALACAAIRWQHVDRLPEAGRQFLEIAGAAGLVGLVWAVSQVDEFDPRLYRGGFLAVAVLSVLVVAAAARPGRHGPLTAALSARPLVWLGRRSYAVYLWFWPVLMLTRPHRDVALTGLPLLALRIGLTLALAAASYRFVERPARAGALGKLWSSLRRRRDDQAPLHRPSAVWATGLAAALFSVGLGVAVSRQPVDPPDIVAEASGLNAALASGFDATLAAAALTNTTVPPTTVPPVEPTSTTADPATTAVASTAPVSTAPATVPAALPVVQARVTAIGDSVLLGAKAVLEAQVEGIAVDAVVGRQFPDMLAAARAHRDTGTVGDVVILQTGNNGPISDDQFDALLETFSGVPKILVVNVKVDRSWQDHNNEVMADGVKRRPNAVLLDWHAVASANPDAFYSDGLHLTATGIRLFTELVLTAI